MSPRSDDEVKTTKLNTQDEFRDELNVMPDVIHDTPEPEVKRKPLQIVWRNVILMSTLHVLAIYGFYLLPRAQILTLIWTGFMYWISGLGITAGAHRLWSHRSYKAKLPLKILLAIFNSMAFQNDVIEWARDHRVHHKFSETDADPHNAKRGFFFSHVGWLLVRKHPDVKQKGGQLDVSDLYADPVLRFQRKFYLPSVILFCFVVPTVVPMYFWGETFINAYFICGILRYCLVLNATWFVNSVAHLWGMRPYDVRINPAENPMVAVVAAGEGFHNYHHTFPYDYSTAELKWFLNTTTMFIDFFGVLGLAYERKTMPQKYVDSRRRKTGDLSELASKLNKVE